MSEPKSHFEMLYAFVAGAAPAWQEDVRHDAREALRGLEEQLDAVARIGFELVYDNMHFHERAMADPFEAESYVQGVGSRITEITGMPKGVRVLDGNPASRED